VLTLTNKGIVEVEERTTANTAGGGAAATTWNERGSVRAWVKTFDTLGSSFLATITDSKLTPAVGTYVIEASCPAYKTDGHQSRITRYNGSNVIQESIFGSSSMAAAADTTQTTSFVAAKMTFASGDYFKVHHYTVTAEATDGLGKAVNAAPLAAEAVFEVYAKVKITKVA